ncbi:hypothetical protein A3E97_03595 [Candidatus Uhrbacteria bacterium RIFCSPHIGHO2_12_FULL_47_12]|nr:MAG: hypothetical protein A2839_04565 [Candidatus Uhrbacteria bacterium RIFCSPHIGHO2_01_FULL_47_10]OGL77519.1 MAG: hypothetical protein A3E97_03595 [Candidatus Uhrbacteria bacterium RIFCSPHIGHO2_12_FULL_47_12]
MKLNHNEFKQGLYLILSLGLLFVITSITKRHSNNVAQTPICTEAQPRDVEQQISDTNNDIYVAGCSGFF